MAGIAVGKQQHSDNMAKNAAIRILLGIHDNHALAVAKSGRHFTSRGLLVSANRNGVASMKDHNIERVLLWASIFLDALFTYAAVRLLGEITLLCVAVWLPVPDFAYTLLRAVSLAAGAGVFAYLAGKALTNGW